MVLKKKPSRITVKAQHTPVALEEPVEKVERKQAVTQVVEVVEEEVPVEHVESTQVVEEKVPLEEAAPVDEVEQNKESPEKPVDVSEPPEDPKADEKRKELVDELFQKKTTGPVQVAPEISMHTKRTTTKPIILWAIGMIVTCLVVGAGILIFSGKAGSLASVVVIPTPTPTPAPKTSPTPTPAEVKRESLTVQVLNGGGVAGAATKMKKILEEKGYKVSDTANAPSYTYDKTEILVKSSKEAYIALLEGDLKTTYKLGSSAATLEDGVSYDARVIVGKE